MPKKSLTALDVANYFLVSADVEAGDVVSNLSLNKLCYYAQGFSLALLDRRLFDESVEAWTHGPVVPSVYHHFKKHRDRNIPPPAELKMSMYSKEVRDLLDEVYEVYGQYSAWKLRNMSHAEPPWKEANRVGRRVITDESMREYFSTLVE